MHQMFSVHNTPQKKKKKKKNHQSSWNSQAGESDNYRDTVNFEKLSSKNVFRTQKRKADVLKFLGVISDLEKLRFPGGLVWTVGLTTESNFFGVVSRLYTEQLLNDCLRLVNKARAFTCNKF